MKIMSDAEAFSLKLTVAILFLVCLAFIVRFCSIEDNSPIAETNYDTITICDTVIIHDTITKWKEKPVQVNVDTTNSYTGDF